MGKASCPKDNPRSCWAVASSWRSCWRRWSRIGGCRNFCRRLERSLQRVKLWTRTKQSRKLSFYSDCSLTLWQLCATNCASHWVHFWVFFVERLSNFHLHRLSRVNWHSIKHRKALLNQQVGVISSRLYLHTKLSSQMKLQIDFAVHCRSFTFSSFVDGLALETESRAARVVGGCCWFRCLCC